MKIKNKKYKISGTQTFFRLHPKGTSGKEFADFGAYKFAVGLSCEDL